MRCVCFYIFLFNFGFTYSLLKDVGEVTNYTLYIESLLKTPNRTKLLVGGIPTGTSHVPHNILFLNYLAVCSGVIISNTIVLTCAHCLDANKNLPDMKVFAGARYVFDNKADVYDVWDFLIHSDYDVPVRFSNDAALLIIRGQFNYKPTIQKAQLVNHRDWMKEGTKFRVSGWEQTSVGEKRTVRGLQSVDLSFVPYRKCMNQTHSSMSPDMFCLFGDGKRGICRGDSGGAAMLDKYVVGLASHNVKCEERPGIFTNVYYLRPWIEAAALKLYHKYCRYHEKWTVTDSKFEGKIVGGVGVPIERYPYAAIVFNYGALCAGSILSSWAVLSAAHCFEMNDDVYDMTIHVGGRHKYDSRSMVHYVQHLEVHADYNKAMPFACDVAILFVETPFNFGSRVQKALIANSNRWMRKGQTNFTVTGWGMIRYNGPVSDMGLLMAQLKYVPRDECGRLHDMTFTEDMFCLYGDGQKDTCKGDSGGGVLWNGLLVGIVSHGDGCAGKDKPSVYANVYYFRKWIQDTLNKYYNKFCSQRRKSIDRRNYRKNSTVNKKITIKTKIK